jgi:hypothetical protein
MEELTRTQEKEVQKEVKEKLAKILTRRANRSAKEFRDEFKKQTLIAITGAFAFLIALTWRTPIQKSIDNLVIKLGLNGDAVYYEYIAAIIITILGVLAIMLITKWASKKK